MSESVAHLRAVPDLGRAEMTCATPGCRLPVWRTTGVCRPCARVHDWLRVLSHRLLVRDLARAEHDTPGIVGAIRCAIGDGASAESSRISAPPRDRGWIEVVPDDSQIGELEGLVVELRDLRREARA